MSADAVPSFRFDTDRIAVAERHEQLQAVVGGVCSVRPAEGRTHADCAARTEAWHLGGLVVVDLWINAQSHARTMRHVRADQMDPYRLSLKLGGRQTCDVGDRLATMDPGGLLLVDQARAECSHFHGDDGHNLVVYLPREALDGLLPQPVDVHGLALRGGGASLLADHLCALVRHLPRITTLEAPSITGATLNLLAACLASDAATRERALPAIEGSLLRQACRHVERHLHEPGLGASAIMAVLGISRSTLYRLFEPFGGVAGYIKERRLRRIHALLAEATRPMQIQRLAEDHGFRTASHLSREFRRLFGYPPSQARQLRHAPALSSTHVDRRATAFHAWVRSLRA